MKHRTLTEQVARAAKPRATRYTITEDGITLEVHPSGKRTVYAKYREHGVQRKELLGVYDPEHFTLKDARVKLLELRHRLEVLQAPTKQTHETLKEYLEGAFKTYIEGARRDAKGTMARLKYHFITQRPDLANTKLRALTRQQIDLWRNTAKATRKTATVNRAFGDLRAALNLAVQWGLLRTSPAVGVKPFQVDDEAEKLYLSDEEFKKLEAGMTKWEALGMFGKPRVRNEHPRWWLLYIAILLNTGARKTEALMLRWCDVDRGERSITLRGIRTKNAKTRRVPITVALLAAIEEHYKDFVGFDAEEGEEATEFDEASEERLFPVDDCKKKWQRFHKLAGLPESVTMHTLRHHVASMMVLRGAALPTVRDLLGHRSLEVTSRYLSVRTADKLQALELLAAPKAA
jgi:integrase